MTTTWNIFDTKRRKSDGVIIKIVYGCTVQQDNYLDRTIAELNITGDASAEGFISYTNLTQDVILNWVKSSIGPQRVLAIETSLRNNVTAQKAAAEAEIIVNGLPWM
jgi:hypothetical protein